MAGYIRRAVSLNKARFKDENLNLELDLVYITDQVIIMGYPASGFEGFYRNRRDHVKKFLDHRHGKNYWVFNFCPIRENSYSASVFEGRVSRYPFPDHHVPPLAILALAAREMRAWLEGSQDRVIVLHCKAGKGRSGTLACAYLLSLDYPPTSRPGPEANEQAKNRTNGMIQSFPDNLGDSERVDDRPITKKEADGGDAADASSLSVSTPPLDTVNLHPARADPLITRTADGAAAVSIPSLVTPPPDIRVSHNDLPHALRCVLDLHTSRRMKPPSPSSKPKHGVSIPSQRRWLYYWSLLLSHSAPSHFWAIPPLPREACCLTQIKLRMREPSMVKMGLVQVASQVLESTNRGKNRGKGDVGREVWASVGRYDDAFVEMLEKWEKNTRDGEGRMGKGKGAGHLEDNSFESTLEGGQWDTGKMVRTFARLGSTPDYPVQKDNSDKQETVVTFTLRPLSDETWKTIQGNLKEEPFMSVNTPSASRTNSIYESTSPSTTSEGLIILEASREVCIKLYCGQVIMGWLWFIPSFHMSPQSCTTPSPPRLLLVRKELDFPLGVGADIVDVEIRLEPYHGGVLNV